MNEPTFFLTISMLHAPYRKRGNAKEEEKWPMIPQLLLLWGGFSFPHLGALQGLVCVTYTVVCPVFFLLNLCYHDILPFPCLFFNSLFHGCMIFKYVDVLKLTHPKVA